MTHVEAFPQTLHPHMTQNPHLAEPTMNPDSETKIVEARTVILFDKSAPLSMHGEFSMWLLKHLFRPLTMGEYDNYHLLHMSGSHKLFWDYKNDAKAYTGPELPSSPSTTASGTPTASTPTFPPTPQQPSNNGATPQKMYIITPRTHILSVAREYRMVFMIDLSSSLATFDTGSGGIMIEHVYTILETILHAIAHPFALNNAATPIMFEPEINITVIAECSQFGSNINVIPILAEYPTMRVLLQNIHVTTLNILSVMKKLSDEIKAFQRDLGSFRKNMKKRRSKMGYELDVRDDHSSAVENESADFDILEAQHPPQSPKKRHGTKKNPKKASKTSPLVHPKTPEPDRLGGKNIPTASTSSHTSARSSVSSVHRRPPKKTTGQKKDTWGVGKSGSNLSYILRAGLFALNMLSSSGRPSLVLITDSVVKSNVQDESLIRQLSRDGVSCNVVQIGSNQGFSPACNFGFVPDNEILKFVASATYGHFMFAEQCQRTTSAVMATTAPPTQPVSPQLLNTGGGPAVAPRPNVYHCRFLFREIALDRPRIDTRLIHPTRARNEDMLSDLHATRPNRYGLQETPNMSRVAAFPWDPHAEPMQVETRLMRYREYSLPAEFWQLIKARMRQGFSLSSVILDENAASSSKRERAMILLSLQWQPGITIEYRIRGNCSSIWYTYLKSSRVTNNSTATDPCENSPDQHGILSYLRNPKAEILIRANSTFSDMLKNWDAFQRRTQMMGAVTGTAGIDFSGSPGLLKVGKLKKLLDRIFETDSMMKALIVFEQDAQTFETFWNRLERSECRWHTRCWYDEHCFDMISGDGSAIYTKLAHWETFEGIHGAHVKMFDRQCTSTERCPQFCEVRVLKEKDHIFNVRMLFFNVPAAARRRVIDELEHLLQEPGASAPLASFQGENPPTPSTPIPETSVAGYTLAKRPISELLIRDQEHYAAMDERRTEMSKMWHVSPTFWLTGEFIVRNYLCYSFWHWEMQEKTETVKSEMVPLQNLAFDYLRKARLDQNFISIALHRSSCHFYKEVKYGTSVIAVQYYIWKDAAKKTIVTELWMEPIVDSERELIKSEVFNTDKTILTRLVTFDQMSSAKEHGLLNETSDRYNYDAVEDALLGIQRIQQASLFHVPSILRLGTFLVATYPCPKYSARYLIQGKSDSSLSLSSDTAELSECGVYFDVIRHQQLDRPPFLNSRTSSKFSPTAMSSPASLNVSGLGVWQSDRIVGCTCPRPDKMFYKYKEDISKLPPIYRDIALLHYYLEQSLKKITDKEMPLERTTLDDFWPLLIKTLVDAPQTRTPMSTLYLTGNVQDLRCFVKIINPSVFVVIVLPSLDAVVKHLHHLEERVARSEEQGDDDVGCNADENGPGLDTINLLMFECHRQTLAEDSEKSDARQRLFDGVGEVVVKPIDPSCYMAWLDSQSAYLRPELSKGRFMAPESLDLPLLDGTFRLMQNVTHVYSRSFVKSVVTSLLHGRAVDEDDFKKVLNICDESMVDIDLTGYLNVQTLLKRRGRTSVEELELAHQRFLAILGHYFEPVISTNGKWQNTYAYRPPFAKAGQKLGLSLSGEKPSNLADVVVCAQNPLFVRVQCTFRKPKEDGTFVEKTFLMDHLPSSYDNFEPELIGSPSSPIDSIDGTTATLHLVCLTLPTTDLDPVNDLLSHLEGCPGDSAVQHLTSYLDEDKLQRESLSTLTEDKQDALVETEARLAWMFTEEIMHGLLRSGPVTQSVIHYVETQLMKKNPFVDFPTTMFMPLVFVKNHHLSRTKFFEELERTRSMPYVLVRVGDCFYASDNTHRRIEDTESMVSDDQSNYDVEGLNITIDAKKKSGTSGNDEFCQGLGISILEPEPEQEEEASLPKEEALDMKEQLYWLLLIPQRQSVQIYFYSKMQQLVNRSEIIRATKTMINEVMERTNKLVLLVNLHDTRICSKYLLPPNDDDERSFTSSESRSDEECETSDDSASDNLVEILSTSGEEVTFTPPKKFLPGQFGCSTVFTKRFSLHWRLQPNSALSILSTDVLQPFAVKNRPNMFVCTRDESIVYCFLSESAIPQYDTDQDTDSLSQLRTTSPYHTLTHTSSESNVLMNSSSQRLQTIGKSCPSPHSSAASDYQRPSPHASPSKDNGSNLSPNLKKSRAREPRELVLEVHGTEYCSWISEELVDLLENRLTSQITLKEVQQFLLRNPTSRLTRADVEFLLPVEKTPTAQQVLRIPTLVANPIHFLGFLKENIIMGPLRALEGSYLTQTVKRHRMLRYGVHVGTHAWHTKENTIKSSTHDMVPGEYCFYYNCSNRTPGQCSPFELDVGQGVAGISLSLLDTNGLALTLVTPRTDTLADFSASALALCLKDDFREDTTAGEYQLGIDIWTIGQIEVSHLLEHIYHSFRQSICDYVIERTVKLSSLEEGQVSRSIDTDVEIGIFQTIMSPFLSVLEKAVEWNSPSVKHMSRRTTLSPWTMDDILLHLDIDLTDLHYSLKPIITRAVLSSDFDHEARKTGRYRVYHPSLDSYSTGDGRLQDERYLLVSGLPELYVKISNASSLASSRRQSTESDLSQLYTRSPYAKMAATSSTVIDEEVEIITTPASLPKSGRDDFVGSNTHSRHDSMASGISGKANPNTSSLSVIKNSKNGHKEAAHRQCFLVFMIDTATITVYAYNCSEVVADHIFQSTLRIISQQEARQQTLSNILHQKMGLFYHTPTMTETLNSTLAPPPVQPQTMLAVTLQKAVMSPSVSGPARFAPPEASPSRTVTSTSISSATNTENKSEANLFSLKQLMTNTFLSRLKLEKYRLLDGELTEHMTGSMDAQQARTLKSLRLEAANASYRSIRIDAIDAVLRDVYSESESEYEDARHRDYLIRHGEPFMSLYLGRSQLEAAHDKALAVYSKWAARYIHVRPRSNHEDIEPMTAAELKLILKASRLLHFCRTPLFLPAAGSSAEHFRLFADTEGGSSLEIMNWYKQLTELLMKEYAAYLQSIGMYLIVYGASTDQEEDVEAYQSRYKVTEDHSVVSPVIYLLRVYKGGTIMCEARLTDVFVSVTLYTLHRRYGRPTDPVFMQEKYEAQRDRFRNFMKECDRFKQRIHVNSFVSDFRLWFIQKSLDDVDALPDSLDLLSIIDHTAMTSQGPGTYSCNRILHGQYTLVMEDQVEHLVTTLLNDASKFGLQTIRCDKKAVGCFVTSNDLSFKTRYDDPKELLWYTLIMAVDDPTNQSDDMLPPAGDKPDKVTFKYFILVTCKDMAHRKKVKTRTQRAQPPNTLSMADPREECSETCSLNDVVQYAKRRMDTLITEAVLVCRRNADWNRLYVAMNAHPSHDDVETLVALTRRFDILPLQDGDLHFGRFLALKLGWSKLLDFLQRMYPLTSGSMHSRHVRHTLLFMPNAVMQSFVHFEQDLAKDTVAVYISSKEKRQQAGVLETIERTFVNSLATTLSYYIWKNMRN